MMFQSTPPRGGRPRLPMAGAVVDRCFNPRPRAGGDRAGESDASADADVSIHAPARGATAAARRRCARRRCFNPRPRAGGDWQRWPSRSSHGRVSIHAPARGATARVGAICGVDCSVSIHAPARGATSRALHAAAPSSSVSIHAPARGATVPVATRSCVLACFNPRPRAGGDQHDVHAHACGSVSIHAPARGATICRKHVRAGLEFQSTPPRGGRRAAQDVLQARDGFNPRPRAGGDDCRDDQRQAVSVSIHAPARGATVESRVPRHGQQFQSTPPRGGRPHGADRAAARA